MNLALKFGSSLILFAPLLSVCAQSDDDFKYGASTKDITKPEALAKLTRDSVKEGNAKGTEFSGTYVINTGQGAFKGPNCTPEFVVEFDLAIRRKIPVDEETRRIVREGYPPTQGELTLEQQNGRLKGVGIGDDHDNVYGWVNQDGTFVLGELHEGVHGGDKQSADAKIGSGMIVRGRISGAHIAGEVMIYAYNFVEHSTSSKGLCVYFTRFEGEKTR